MLFKTKKKNSGIIALVICMMFTIASCSSEGASEQSTADSGTKHLSSEDNKDRDEVIINFAVLGKADYITNAVTKFNETDNGYHIELIDYYNDSDKSSTGSLKLNDFELMQDIINKDEIDMITSLSFTEESNYRILVEKGAFTDLYKFMKDDPDVNTSTLNTHILSINETNGSLFTIPTFFIANTMIGDAAYVGSTNNWTFDDLFSHWKKMPDNATITGERTKEAAYRAFIRKNLATFVDFKTGKTYFDSDDFRNALVFCNKFEYANQEKTDLDFDAPKFCTECSISSFQAIYPFKLSDPEPNFTFVGYPSSNGEGAYLRSFGDCFSISAKSSEKKQQGAWDFIRLFFLPEYQEEHALSIYDRNNGYASQNCFCINKIANEHIKCNTVDKKYSSATYEDKGKIFSSEFPSIEDCNALESYLNSIDRWEVRLDESIVSVIDEEVMAFFADEISIDECINRIQNRTSIWISEKI